MQAQPAPTQNIALSVGEDVASGRIKNIVFQSLNAMGGWIRTLLPVYEKLDSKYIVGATFLSSQRTLQNMAGATMIQLDFDKPIDDAHMSSVSLSLELAGISHIAFETFSSCGKFVVLIPYSKPATEAEHKASIDSVAASLGGYALGLDPASYSPVLPRFVSPNANHPAREVTVFNGKPFEPIKVQAYEEFPANVTPINQIAQRRALDNFELFNEQATPQEKILFLEVLRNNLLPADRLEEYPRWFPVVYACFRAWAVISPTLSESQREMVQTLESWCKHSPKWEPEAINKKLRSWLSDGGSGSTPLHIRSLLTHEVDEAAFRAVIANDEGMTAAFNKIKGATPVTVVSDEEIEQAITRQKARDDALAAIDQQGLTFLSRAPFINERFSHFINLVIRVATQNNVREAWELPQDQWDYFLRPSPILFGLLQSYAMGFAPHVLFRMSDSLSPVALNIYHLAIAGAGTGKSVTIDLTNDIGAKTIFCNSLPKFKLNSATALWINAFQKHGQVQLLLSDEAESLFGKAGKFDQNLVALHTTVKQLFDQGVPGKHYQPSALVQRDLEQMNAPTFSMNLAATPVLLREDISSGMMHDGFLSRVIVNIDSRSFEKETEEQLQERIMRLLELETDKTYEDNVSDIVKFFNGSWRSPEADHPSGRTFFNYMGDETADELNDRIRAHFEMSNMPVRYIMPPKDKDGMKRFSALCARAERRWDIPHTFVGTTVEANINSLKVRSRAKLLTVASILSLVADPGAKVINLDIMEWAEEILFTAQHPFFLHLIKMGRTESPSMRVRVNPEFIDTLRPAIDRGGPLRTSQCTSRQLREFSRAWRKLIANLACPPLSDEYRVAIEALSQLGVGFKHNDNTHGTTFFMLGELDE